MTVAIPPHEWISAEHNNQLPDLPARLEKLFTLTAQDFVKPQVHPLVRGAAAQVPAKGGDYFDQLEELELVYEARWRRDNLQLKAFLAEVRGQPTHEGNRLRQTINARLPPERRPAFEAVWWIDALDAPSHHGRPVSVGRSKPGSGLGSYLR